MVIWFSRNTPNYLQCSICSSLGVKATAFLGSYLGVPVLHKCVRKSTYQYLVNRVRKKLASLKIRLLSRAAQLVLIKSTLMAISLYTMQSVAVPRGVLAAIERVCWAFFWGDVGAKKHLHTINWQTVCLPKQNGDLCLLCLQSMNQALLAKVGQWMLMKPSAISSIVLRSKYGERVVDGTDHKRMVSSATWKVVINATHVLRKGINWIIGSGTSVSFWLAIWAGNSSLLASALYPLSAGEKSNYVSSYWDFGCGWKLDFLRQKLAPEALQRLSALVVYPDVDLQKILVQAVRPNGLFLVHSARQLLAPRSCARVCLMTWSNFLKLHGQPRATFTLWCLFHGGLPSNFLLWKRGI